MVTTAHLCVCVHMFVVTLSFAVILEITSKLCISVITAVAHVHTVPLKCIVVLRECEQLKKLAN